MSRLVALRSKEALVPAKRKMAKARLQHAVSYPVTKAAQDVEAAPPSVADIIDEHHDQHAKIIRSRRGRQSRP